MNKFFVGIQGDTIVLLKPVPQKLTKEEALNLAAWLVALADDTVGTSEGPFAKQLEEVLQS